ncbi:helix-turn-helix transcriptional regulator [Streptomyces sp. SKN60]|uniref:helix-turn-helix domain-containing protein n=1 Tax=Streptomyces sp. SKN60 TaxID=2855506 RepID=UPI0022460FE8|nr:helix-turn-helix transcriptional regulator [Streptomyces sp. SKN60]MCX2185550.1 helix-turn-helix transcriptional regulator [Streptomyces sp. SKN60]
MPSSPSSSVQAAREAVAARLRELMMEAGLRGHELAARCGWNAAKTSRIINAKTQPSDADIRAWCAACGADDQAADLVASARAVDFMYVEWRRLQRNGLRKVQEDFYALHEQSALCRVYVSNVMPGFFQTAPYATAVLQAVTRFWATPDDVVEAVASRVARSRFLYEGRHRFAVVMEEWVLRSRIGDVETMAGQLRHLLAVLPLASVSLGVIPSTASRTLWPMEAFYLYDDRRAVVETLTAEINVTQPREIADYARAFADLAKMAVYGDEAKARINAAIDSLG